MPFYQIQWEVW